MPHPFGVPRPREIRLGDGLVGHVPTAVAAGDDVDQSRVIALVAVIVVGEHVSVLVNRQFLRVSEPRVNSFQLRPIRIAAIDRASSGIGNRVAFLGHDVSTTIADGKVQLAVDSPNETVEVVAIEGGVDAKAGQERPLAFSHAVAVLIFQQPEAGNARVPDFAIASDQAGTQPIQWTVETISKHLGDIGFAVAILIFQSPHDVRFLSKPRAAFVELAGPFLLHRQPVLKRFDLQVVFQ